MACTNTYILTPIPLHECRPARLNRSLARSWRLDRLDLILALCAPRRLRHTFPPLNNAQPSHPPAPKQHHCAPPQSLCASRSFRVSPSCVPLLKGFRVLGFGPRPHLTPSCDEGRAPPCDLIVNEGDAVRHRVRLELGLSGFRGGQERCRSECCRWRCVWR
jgi:hypothetical protein